ncbi:putative sulfur carrier protein NMA0882 [Azospirillaceae bacterium]
MMNRFLDVKGHSCPLPVLRTRKALLEMPEGAVLTVEATDPASARDMPSWCVEAGHQLLESLENDGIFRFRIEKKRFSTNSE